MHYRDLDDLDWELRVLPTLDHIPPTNDEDGIAALLGAHEPPPEARPEARRLSDAIMWQANTYHYPARLWADVHRWVRGHCNRERLDGPRGSYAAAEIVAAYCLGHRDKTTESDDTAPSDALAWVYGAVCGSLGTLGLMALGYALAH